jgi:hypothetical protein
MNSGTTIVDKLGFMLQEEEYPVDIVTIKDLLVLKRQQVTMLKHAFKFPKVQHILYQTRSTHAEENEQVVIETLDRWGVEWKLNCVLPDIPVDNEKENEIEECLTIDPSTGKGNGIFIAHFQLKPPKVEPERHRVHTQHTEHMTVGELEEQVEQVMKPKRKKKERKRGELLKFKLPKQLRSSVNRLSVPRLSTIDQKHQIIVKKDHKKEKVPIAVSEKVAAVPVVLERTPSQQAEFDMAVFGLSLSKFYGPRADALKQLQLKKMIANKPSWIYPV